MWPWKRGLPPAKGASSSNSDPPDGIRKHGFSAMVVEEASARHGYPKFLSVGADHFGVCKPSDKATSSFLALKNFIVEVVAAVEEEKDDLLELPSYVVGMDSRVKEVCEKWEGHSVVGLVGMGGIGKTTLSKYVYRAYRAEEEKFQACCFLEDVKSRGGNIETCQRELFHELCGERWDESRNVNYHMAKIRKCIYVEEGVAGG